MGKASGTAGSAAGRRRDGQGVGGAGLSGRGRRDGNLGGRGTAKPSGRTEYQAASGSHKFAGRNLRGPLEFGSNLGPHFLKMGSYLEK